jgi:hypothetical protein
MDDSYRAPWQPSSSSSFDGVNSWDLAAIKPCTHFGQLDIIRDNNPGLQLFWPFEDVERRVRLPSRIVVEDNVQAPELQAALKDAQVFRESR